MLDGILDFLRWVIYSTLGKMILAGLLALPVIAILGLISKKSKNSRNE